MNELKIFENDEFGQVRTVLIDGKHYFVAIDIAKALNYSNTRKAILDHCKGVTKRDVLTKGGIQTASIIPEGDIYRLIVKSKLPSAEKFEKWVFDEVLPSIRKTGTYSIDIPKTLPEALRLAADLAEKNEQLQLENAEMQPKAEFFDTVADSKTAIEMSEVAKVLGIKGLGRNKLFELLRDEKILRQNNQPYQKYVDFGHFRVLEQTYNKKDGSTHISIKTLVYQKGVDYIRKTVTRVLGDYIQS